MISKMGSLDSSVSAWVHWRSLHPDLLVELGGWPWGLGGKTPCLAQQVPSGGAGGPE